MTDSRGIPSALAGGAVAMVLVGSSVATSATLAGSPVLTGQALRYAAASALLVVIARLAGRPVARPRGRQWGWLLAVTAMGLVLFNLALVHGAAHAEPAVLGVAVACVPLALAAAGPLIEGSTPSRRVLMAALVVTLGAALVVGLGRTDLLGVGYAVVVFATEAGFTLCALPVLAELGAYSVSVHTTWLAVVMFGALGLVLEGPSATTRLEPNDLVALGWLALAVTAVAFVLWYGSVRRVGAGRSGLLTGIAPISAAATGVLLGGHVPGPAVWLGVLLVAAGLGIGFSRPRAKVVR